MNVKLCGLTTSEDVENAREAGATHVGFVVQAPDSHRNLETEEAADLAAEADEMTSVLVTPTDDADEAREAIEAVDADVLQATGSIQPGPLLAIAEDLDVDAWKGIGLADKAAGTVERIDAYRGVDAVVLDALLEGYGGHGESIDWGHAGQARRSIATPLVLAGGLTAVNVAEAVQAVDPWCVDVSSGIETDGANDPDKMRAFVEAAMEAEP